MTGKGEIIMATNSMAKFNGISIGEIKWLPGYEEELLKFQIYVDGEKAGVYTQDEAGCKIEWVSDDKEALFNKRKDDFFTLYPQKYIQDKKVVAAFPKLNSENGDPYEQKVSFVGEFFLSSECFLENLLVLMEIEKAFNKYIASGFSNCIVLYDEDGMNFSAKYSVIATKLSCKSAEKSAVNELRKIGKNFNLPKYKVFYKPEDFSIIL